MNNTQVRHISITPVPFHHHRVPFRTLVCRHLLVFLAILGMMALPGCGETKTSDRDLVMVNADEARQLFDRGGGGLRIGRTGRAAWVDPRSEAEFRGERIAGAIHLPLDRARDEHRPLREYDILIVYGNDFNSPRAAALSKMLIEYGHRDVRTLRGGLRAWKAAGHTIESDGG